MEFSTKLFPTPYPFMENTFVSPHVWDHLKHHTQLFVLTKMLYYLANHFKTVYTHKINTTKLTLYF